MGPVVVKGEDGGSFCLALASGEWVPAVVECAVEGCVCVDECGGLYVVLLVGVGGGAVVPSTEATEEGPLLVVPEKAPQTCE